MSKRHPCADGGPAFPVLTTLTDKGKLAGLQTGPSSGWETGLSIRDYFAAKAMQAAFCSDTVAARDGRYDETNWAEVVALNAYEMADAMLKERAK